jgi:hypothetical protein
VRKVAIVVAVNFAAFFLFASLLLALALLNSFQVALEAVVDIANWTTDSLSSAFKLVAEKGRGRRSYGVVREESKVKRRLIEERSRRAYLS